MYILFNLVYLVSLIVHSIHVDLFFYNPVYGISTYLIYRHHLCILTRDVTARIEILKKVIKPLKRFFNSFMIHNSLEQ